MEFKEEIEVSDPTSIAKSDTLILLEKLESRYEKEIKQLQERVKELESELATLRMVPPQFTLPKIKKKITTPSELSRILENRSSLDRIPDR